MHLAQLGAEGLADRAHRPLGGGVKRPRERPPPGDRAREHVMAGPALEQVGEGCPHREGNAQDVGEDHRAPVLRGILQKAALGAEAGVREHGVDAAERFERGVGQRLVVSPLRHVAPHAHPACRSEPIGPAALDQLDEAVVARRQAALEDVALVGRVDGGFPPPRYTQLRTHDVRACAEALKLADLAG